MPNQSELDLASLRTEYSRASLDITSVVADPLLQFKHWFTEATDAGVLEPSAMMLATTSAEGIPSARVVLLKGLDNGFVFYTNYASHKGQDLEENPAAALLFFWPELQRQVRIQGTVHRTTEEESTAYFQSRPHDSQIGAWASAQSTVIESREALDQLHAEFASKFQEGSVPKPPTWGGFRLMPTHIEFWQGRPSRLHDRIRYRLVADTWTIERLCP